MAIAVKFYTFSKKKNSTKQPTGGTTFNCNLKDNSGILKPIIELDTSNPSAYNYAYIAAYGRYYFVGEWVYYRGVWTSTLTVDVFATYRSDLLSSSQYVTRSASDSDSFIIDTKYPITTDIQTQNISVVGTDGHNRPFMTAANSPRHVMAVTNGSDQTSGNPRKINGATYYCMTPGESEMLISYLLSEPTYMTLDPTEISNNMAKTISNPLQYIGDSYMLAFTPPITMSQAMLYAGWWLVDLDHGYTYLPREAAYQKWKIWESTQITIPSHPQTQQVGIFVNASRYTTVLLFAGIFGVIPIDSTLCAKYQNMKLEVYADFKGKCELDILFYDSDASAYFLWSRHYAESSVPINMTQLNSNMGKAVEGLMTNGLSTLNSINSLNPIGMVQGMNGIIDSAKMLNASPMGQAIAGSSAYLLDDFFIQVEHNIITETSPNILGSPLCKNKVLSTLSGYCECLNPFLDIAAYSSEYAELISGMTSGFYIE